MFFKYCQISDWLKLCPLVQQLHASCFMFSFSCEIPSAWRMEFPEKRKPCEVSFREFPLNVDPPLWISAIIPLINCSLLGFSKDFSPSKNVLLTAYSLLSFVKKRRHETFASNSYRRSSSNLNLSFLYCVVSFLCLFWRARIYYRNWAYWRWKKIRSVIVLGNSNCYVHWVSFTRQIIRTFNDKHSVIAAVVWSRSPTQAPSRFLLARVEVQSGFETLE